MPEQIQKILDRIIAWWKKFNNKQRVLLISITAAILLSLGILAYAVSRPTMVTLVVCDDAKEASQINTLLSGSSVKYETDSSGLVFKVRDKDEAQASYLLAEQNIPSQAYSIENVVDGGFSRTESDRQKLYQDMLEKKFASHLQQFDNVESATVDITLPKDDGTILNRDEQGTASVQLELSRDITEEQAYGFARFVATQLGNDDTTGIVILNKRDGTILYSGTDSQTASAVISSQLSNKTKQEELMRQKVVNVLLNTKMFADINAQPNLDVDYSIKESSWHNFSAPEGMSQGMITSQSTYDATTEGGVAAIPGTDANDDNGYFIDNGETGRSEISQTDTHYSPNEEITKTTDQGGRINYENSTIAVSAVQYVTYDEDQLKASGALDDITFAEFIAQNSQSTALPVDEAYIQLVSGATGIPVERIQFTLTSQPVFVESEGSGFSVSNIFQILLAVLIFALLGYVVFRSTRKQPEPEVEPELSVEGLLEATAEQQEALEDIGYSEKSETRLLIEKFVDENPDAVALLLRNWLNEEWE